VKDSVPNRRRIPFATKLHLAAMALRENGLRWFALFGTYYLSSSLSARAFDAMERLRRSRGVPGLNSASMNKAIWEAWDWSGGGREFGTDAWKESVIRCLLEPHLPAGGATLEIGPGSGRWTEALIGRSSRFVAVDISQACVDVCRARFAASKHATFLLGSGRDLSGVESGSIDALWSFDVFVHVNTGEVRAYAPEFARVLRPGGRGAIHHGGVAGVAGGWRSDLTRQAMIDALEQSGLRVLHQFAEWQDGGTRQQLDYQDAFTVFEKASPDRAGSGVRA
jgi:ubiquinone/menaquinone biosynthesis C-methylase UbiE